MVVTIIIQEEEIIVRNWKKRKVKNQKLVKNYNLYLDEQELSVQSVAQTEPKQCKSAVEELRIPQNLGTGIAISENKYKEIVGVVC